ncbi:MAG: response regulator [Deltaproteobacteria bacterium]|nr:response regulator [Deltaproteobacteria bacterium]
MAEKKHILVAEDEEKMRQAVEFILQWKGYTVSAAKNGREALNIIIDSKGNKRPVDLLITDMQMPQMDGLELIDEIRKSGAAMPVIAMTGNRDVTIRYSLMEKDFSHCLFKPFGKDELLNSINAAIEERDGNKKAPKKTYKEKKYS